VIAYDLAQRGLVALRIYDLSGRLVRSLVSAAAEDAGPHSLEWDGRDDAGGATLAGLYFVRLEAGEKSSVLRVVRIR
jgi:flagellar hook assembly protein FlgD